jgi:hypothetical protein
VGRLWQRVGVRSKRGAVSTPRSRTQVEPYFGLYRGFRTLSEAGLWPFVSGKGRVRSSPQSARKEVIYRCVPYQPR